MNTRKMMALLGPKTSKMDGGGGGGKLYDQLTPQDIAAAIGMIKTRPGRDLYEYLWLPQSNATERKRQELISRFAYALMREQDKRRIGYSVELKFPNPPLKLCGSADKPSAFIFGMTIASCCLDEMSRHNDCLNCGGIGEVLHTKLGKVSWALCPKCVNGKIPFSERTRSRMLGVSWSIFVKQVEQPYKWLLGYMKEQEELAATEHYEALR